MWDGGSSRISELSWIFFWQLASRLTEAWRGGALASKATAKHSLSMCYFKKGRSAAAWGRDTDTPEEVLLSANNMQQRFLQRQLRSAFTEFCWLNLLFCFAVIVSVKQSCSWKCSFFPSVCLFLLRFLLLRQYWRSFIFFSKRRTSNFGTSPPKLQFLPTPPVCMGSLFLLSRIPSKVLPALCFQTLKVARLLRSLLIHTNDCPFVWCQWERRKNKQKDDNRLVLQSKGKRKTSEGRGAEKQLSWTSRPAPAEG